MLPYTACKLMSADMFLISVAIWSTLQLFWGMVTIINIAEIAGKALMRRIKKPVDID